MSNPPITGLESLQPLCAYGMLYLLFLVALRFYLIPFAEGIRKRSKLKVYVHTLGDLLQRLLFVGFLILGAIFAIGVLFGDAVVINLDFSREQLTWRNLLIFVGAVALFLLLWRRFVRWPRRR